MNKRKYYYFPPYDPNNLNHLSFCLRLVFSGNIGTNNHSLDFSIKQHRGHFHRWFVNAFQMPMTFRMDRRLNSQKRNRVVIRKRATHFLRQALDSGWRFGKQHWRIPESIYQQHPLMILRHWIGLKVRLFLFVTRRGNPNRTATTIIFQTVNHDGAHRISQLLTQYNIVHNLTRYQTNYPQHIIRTNRKIKDLSILRIYGFLHAIQLFQLLGWDRPEYAEPHHIKVLHQIVGSHLFPQRVSQFHKEGFYHEEKFERNQLQTVSV